MLKTLRGGPRATAWSRLLVMILLFAPAPALGQTAGAGIQGTLKSPSGTPSNLALVLCNTKTGATWAIRTDASGRFQAPLLPSGDYELLVSAQDFLSFGSAILENLELAVGQDAVINLAVSSEAGTQPPATVMVAKINLTSGTLSGLVDKDQIRELPLNGRSFQQLALLEPGVTAALAAGNDVVGGRTPKISINGARPEQNSFLLDGTDINNVYNKTPGSVAGVLLGVEAVREFQVLTNSFSAEFGRAPGGLINAVTRSGENAVHGSAFEFLRNSAVDAKNFFDPPSAPIPPLKRNQFGGTLGGPIKRDKTFFFGTYEYLIERLGITGLANVPDEKARRGILPSGPVQLHPAIPAYIDTLFPLPNGRNLGGGAAEYSFSRSQPTNERFAQGRIDHRFSAADSVFGRYTISDGNVDRQPINKVPIAFTKERSRNQYLTLEHQHVFSPALLNTLRAGFSRSVSEADNQRTINIPPSLSFLPGEPFGFITIAGLVTELAGDYRLPRNDRLNNYQWGDTMFVTRGAHGLRLGASGQRLQFNQYTISQRGGVVTFPSLASFLQGRPQNVDFAVPGKVDPVRGYRQSVWALFMQDNIRLKQNLTLNAGLHYEFATVPAEVNGKISNLRHVTDTELSIGDPWFSNPSMLNFAPRVGLAWDPFNSGKTSLRAGFGLFYDLMLPKYYFFSGSLNPPFTTRTSIMNPPFPNVLANFDWNARIAPQLQTMNFDLASPYLMHFNLSFQRLLPGDWELAAAYAGSRGIHLLRLGDANLAPEMMVDGHKIYQPELGRRNPNFAGVWQRVADAQSFYNALQLSAVKRLSRGLRAQGSYTFSRSIDDSSGINSQDFNNSVQYVMDWYDRKMDRGLSSFHAAHVVSFNWTWDVPAARWMTGARGALFKGWQLNNITMLQTGHPFTVRLGFNRSGNLNTTSFSQHERPDVKPGYSNNPILGGPDRYWDINAFQLPPPNQRGNLGRNTLIGPGLSEVDLSLLRSFRLQEGWTLQFRTEVFNVANHPNFATPSGQITFTNASGAIAPDWGRIRATTTTSRQVQFGLKLTF